MKYETEGELDKALWAKIARRKHTSLSFPPYDDADIRVVLGGRGARKRDAKQSESEDKLRFRIPSAFCINNYQYTSSVREALGISNPVRVEDLPAILATFEAPVKKHLSDKDIEYLRARGFEIRDDFRKQELADSDLPFSYPIARYALSSAHDEWVKFGFEGFPTYQIKQVSLSTEVKPALTTFKWLLDMQSSDYGIHPALILAFYLCDIYIRDDITILLEDSHVTLTLPSYAVTDKEIRLAYSQTRELLTTPPTRKTGPSPRVRELCAFRRLHSQLNWREFLREWNRKYPEWKYKNVASMQVVLSRVSKWMNSKDEWVEDVRNKIGAYIDWLDSPNRASPFYHKGWEKVPEDVKSRLVAGKGTEKDHDVLADADYRVEHPGWDLIPKNVKKRIIKGIYDYSDVLEIADKLAKEAQNDRPRGQKG